MSSFLTHLDVVDAHLFSCFYKKVHVGQRGEQTFQNLLGNLLGEILKSLILIKIPGLKFWRPPRPTPLLADKLPWCQFVANSFELSRHGKQLANPQNLLWSWRRPSFVYVKKTPECPNLADLFGIFNEMLPSTSIGCQNLRNTTWTSKHPVLHFSID